MTRAIAQDSSWRLGYRDIAYMQFAIAAMLLISLGLWKGRDHGSARTTESAHILRDASVLKSSAPWFAVFLFFLFTGAEATVGLWANSMFVESRHISKDTAGLWVSFYFGAVMMGRFLSGVIVNRLGNRFLIRVGLIISIAGTAMMFCRTAPIINMTGIILIGLGLAPLFPCMMHETPRRFDKKTSDVLIGYQVGAAYLGGSALPALLGLVFSATTLEMLTPCLIGLLAAMLVFSEKLYYHSGKPENT